MFGRIRPPGYQRLPALVDNVKYGATTEPQLHFVAAEALPPSHSIESAMEWNGESDCTGM